MSNQRVRPTIGSINVVRKSMSETNKAKFDIAAEILEWVGMREKSTFILDSIIKNQDQLKTE